MGAPGGAVGRSALVAGANGRSRKRLMSAASRDACADAARSAVAAPREPLLPLLELARGDRPDLRHLRAGRERHQVLDDHALNGAGDLRFVRVGALDAKGRRDQPIDDRVEPRKGRIERVLLNQARRPRVVEQDTPR